MDTNQTKKDLRKIIDNYVAGKASPAEIEFIERYYQYLDKGEDALEHVGAAELAVLAAENYQAIQSKILQSKPKHRYGVFYRYAAAAVLVFALGIGVFYMAIQPYKKHTLSKITKRKTLDVLPGIDQAILTLGDGSKVVLTGANNENIMQKAGLTISKTKDGQLVYTVNQIAASGRDLSYNTIQTANGNQYQVLLPDGTKVWLNAASSLKYPELFTGKERRVVLTGEAYFEVAKNKQMPFRVETRNQTVEVLGTHFNINSYMDDKSIKTTLLEGSVSVTNGHFKKILVPGEQAVVADQGLGTIRIVSDIDGNDEIAWKNGLFRFNNAGLVSILNQLERWYDIKVDYHSIPDKRYNGMVPRSAKLSEVLKMLELTGNIHFKIEENKVLKVLPH